jgi:hypothetical protein
LFLNISCDFIIQTAIINIKLWKRIAILATNGFEEVELSSPKEYLEQQGD